MRVITAFAVLALASAQPILRGLHHNDKVAWAGEEDPFHGTDGDKVAFAGEVDAIHSEINLYRANKGLPELCKSPILVMSANTTANLLTKATKITHKLSQGTEDERITAAGYKNYDDVAENLAASSCTVSEETCSKLVVQQWQVEPESLANLDGDFNEHGAAAFLAPNGVVYWSSHFGKVADSTCA